VTGASGFDVVQEAQDKILSEAAKPVSRTALDRAAVEGMLKALGDKWANYLPASEYAQFRAVLDGHYTGVGVWVRRDADGAVRIASVLPGSPAAQAGVTAGEEVVAVGGKPVAGRTIMDVVTDLRGTSGTAISLTLSADGAQHTLDLRRSSVQNSDVTATVVDDVMVIRVSAFTHGVGDRVAQFDSQARAHHLSGIVLDLRGNPGGLLDEAVRTASAFLSGGLVVTYEQRDEPATAIHASGGGDTSMRLAVLVDGDTASAAEIVTAALQDRNRAIVVGSQTYGKGSVQRPTTLSDGSAIELTVGRYVPPSGRAMDGVGIAPHVAVVPGPTPAQAQARAIEVLSGLLADAGTGGHG
jgi:carboxyl-terminal processing protease